MRVGAQCLPSLSKSLVKRMISRVFSAYCAQFCEDHAASWHHVIDSSAKKSTRLQTVCLTLLLELYKWDLMYVTMYMCEFVLTGCHTCMKSFHQLSSPNVTPISDPFQQIKFVVEFWNVSKW